MEVELKAGAVSEWAVEPAHRGWSSRLLLVFFICSISNIMFVITLIGSHDSDSQLGTTPVVSGGRMLMYWAGSSQTASTREARPK